MEPVLARAAVAMGCSPLDDRASHNFGQQIGDAVRPDFAMGHHEALVIEVIDRQAYPSPMSNRERNLA